MNSKAPSCRPNGLTLIELLVTLTVLAIVATIATPSLADIIRSNRVSSQTNEIVALLHLARNEAIRQNTLDGEPVTVEFNVPDTGTGWGAFVRPPSAADTAAGCEVGTIRCLTRQNVLLDFPGTDEFFFNNRGYLVDGLGALVTSGARVGLRHANTTDDRYARCVFIRMTGQVTTTAGPC